MNKYAVVLRFDRSSEDKINEIIHAAAKAAGNYRLTETAFPPHITIGCFMSEDGRDIAKTLGENISLFSGGEIRLLSLGAFVPRVLFIAPVKYDHICRCCKTLHDVLSGYEAADNGYYMPENLAPHCTIATRLEGEQIKAAFSAASDIFRPFAAKATGIAIAPSDGAYEELYDSQI